MPRANVSLYHMFLYEFDFSENAYFKGIAAMLDVENIKKHGRLVPSVAGSSKYKTIYSAYQGTGEVFAVVVEYGKRSAAYVPTVSYSCDLKRISDTCFGPGRS